MQQQLDALESRSSDLATALEAARAQIGVDTGHAQDLAAQLKAAKHRLARLQATIATASRAAQVRSTTTTVLPAVVTPAPTTRGGGDDGVGEHDD
jgi:peptidoglycan hydrolase CwlO-like protein